MKSVCRHLPLLPISRAVACQVLVFHFPRVIQRVKCGVPNQIPKRPGAGHFALGVERPDGIEISLAVCAQALVDKDHTDWRLVTKSPDGKILLDLTGKCTRRKE